MLEVKGWENFTPTTQDTIVVWWTVEREVLQEVARREVNALIILVLHSIWKERNRRVFDNVAMTRNGLASLIWDEWSVW